MDRSPASFMAEAKFRAQLVTLGAELLEHDWLGSHARHRVRCACGRIRYSRPSNIQQGRGVCRTCAWNEKRFRAALAKLGATLPEPGWRGMGKPHHVLCAAGHDCHPRPRGVLQNGQGICRACVGLDPMTSEANFRARLAELGVILMEPYKNATAKHRARCAQGHECWPQPHTLQRGKGACRACAGQDPVTAEVAFRAALAEFGATPLFDRYMGNHKPHHARCPAGHEIWPRPMVVAKGHSICPACTFMIWDVFYVVAHKTEPWVKFGITNLTGRVRLATHRRRGYTTVVRLATGLPGRVAQDTEDAVRAALALAGERPVRGREYFDASCLALILDVADSWLPWPDDVVA